MDNRFSMSIIAESDTASSGPDVSFITLGCAKNEVDSDRMKARVLAAGFNVIEDLERADAIIINTCAFLTEATEESLAMIFQTLDLDSISKGNGKLVVAGCLPSRYKADLYSELPEVAAFIPTDAEDTIVDVLTSILSVEEKPYSVQQSMSARESVLEEGKSFLRTVDAPWAYVKISDGCDRFCSFCTIPFIRGRYRSRFAEEIFSEVDGLVAKGVREIILIGQDTGIWGKDLTRRTRAIVEPDSSPEPEPELSSSLGLEPEPSPVQGPANLAQLLGTLASRHPQTWIRVMYLQPLGVTDELLNVMSKHDNICKYLDIPLQHASKRVLRDMNRTGDGSEFLELLGKIRATLPSVVLRTTVIAGFPGETKADFKELEDFLRVARFDYVGVFAYSQEEGTKAGDRSDQVSSKTRRIRAQKLRDLVDQIGFELNEQKLGMTCEVLICGEEEDELADGLADNDSSPESSYLCEVDSTNGAQGLIARTQGQAPDVDGVVHLEEGDVGSIVSVSITGAYCYELEAEILEVVRA